MVIFVGVFDAGEIGILFPETLINFDGVVGITYCFPGDRTPCGEIVIVLVGVCDP